MTSRNHTDAHYASSPNVFSLAPFYFQIFPSALCSWTPQLYFLLCGWETNLHTHKNQKNLYRVMYTLSHKRRQKRFRKVSDNDYKYSMPMLKLQGQHLTSHLSVSPFVSASVLVSIRSSRSRQRVSLNPYCVYSLGAPFLRKVRGCPFT